MCNTTCITALQPGCPTAPCLDWVLFSDLSKFRNFCPFEEYAHTRRFHQRPTECNRNNWRESQSESRGHSSLGLQLSCKCHPGSRPASLRREGIRDTQDTQPTKRSPSLFYLWWLLFLSFFLIKVNLSESLNSNLEVNAGARSGLKGYGNLVFETYEKKVGGLVPQPPGWTSLHPHSISKLRKVHKNSRETWPRSTARPFSNIWTLWTEAGIRMGGMTVPLLFKVLECRVFFTPAFLYLKEIRVGVADSNKQVEWQPPCSFSCHPISWEIEEDENPKHQQWKGRLQNASALSSALQHFHFSGSTPAVCIPGLGCPSGFHRKGRGFGKPRSFSTGSGSINSSSVKHWTICRNNISQNWWKLK